MTGTRNINLPGEYASYYKRLVTDQAKRDLLYWLAENDMSALRHVIKQHPGEIDRLRAYQLMEYLK